MDLLRNVPQGVLKGVLKGVQKVVIRGSPGGQWRPEGHQGGQPRVRQGSQGGHWRATSRSVNIIFENIEIIIILEYYIVK